MSTAVLRPGILFGPYPMRKEAKPGWLESTLRGLIGSAANHQGIKSSQFRRFVRAVNDREQEVQSLSPVELRDTVQQLRERLVIDGLTDPLTVQAFALVREVAKRTLGMRHFDSQLIGGWVMANGMLAEMETGEGKTLTATLPAVTAALAGIPVHILTANDYLVRRDSESMRPVFAAFGLTVGCVTEEMSAEERRASYSCDVAYCTGKQVAFDHLKDRLVMGDSEGQLSLKLERLHADNARVDRLLMRGLCFAIVDEADNILIDEARTPLIISQGDRNSAQEQACRQALDLASRLDEGRDYVVEAREREIVLTDEGEARIKEPAEQLGGIWTGRRRRHELVRQALMARRFFVRDKHYLVQNGKVQIIDEFTGRVMADRSWGQGLHQMIEVNEGCEVTATKETLARISFQRFFRRYLRLAGMTGTASEVGGELQSVYGLQVVRVPPNRTPQRILARDRVYARADGKLRAVVARVREVHDSGAPVLIGTRSVAGSEELSARLTKEGLQHRLLNARQDRHEADVVAEAGQRGQITIATNMAGRGTDIHLGSDVRELGGLHVIATERHEAGRIDRQLFGRSGRQGDPGRAECILSLEDELPYRFLPDWFLRLFLGKKTSDVDTDWIGRFLIRSAQRLAERNHRRARGDLLRLDERLESGLGFAGRGE